MRDVTAEESPPEAREAEPVLAPGDAPPAPPADEPAPAPAARGEGAARKWILRTLEVFGPLLVAALIAWPFVELAPPRGYRYRASSAQPGYQQRGWTGITAADRLFVHTKNQKDPWVDIVPAKRTVRRVTVWNRKRNRDRAVPLVLEIPDGKGGFRELGRHEESFAETTFTFPPVTTKKLRLRVDGKKTFLHLSRVEVD